MAVHERRRRELFQAAANAFGEEPAQTMFELLPPPGTRLATDEDIASLHRRFDAVDQRFRAMDERFDAVDQRFEDLIRYLDTRIDASRDRVVAAFRGELITAVTGQTRAVLAAIVTTVVSIGGLVFAFDRFL